MIRLAAVQPQGVDIDTAGSMRSRLLLCDWGT